MFNIKFSLSGSLVLTGVRCAFTQEPDLSGDTARLLPQQQLSPGTSKVPPQETTGLNPVRGQDDLPPASYVQIWSR